MKSYISSSVAVLREKLSQSIGLPFAQLLPESLLEKLLTEEGVRYRKRLFCPIVTLWTWLSQVLDPDKSCKNALSGVVAFLVAAGLDLPSTNTSAYCQARGRLGENFLLRLVRLIGLGVDPQQETQWLWCGREVAVVDGSGMTMADTSQNQKEFPQPKSGV